MEVFIIAALAIGLFFAVLSTIGRKGEIEELEEQKVSLMDQLEEAQEETDSSHNAQHDANEAADHYYEEMSKIAAFLNNLIVAIPVSQIKTINKKLKKSNLELVRVRDEEEKMITFLQVIPVEEVEEEVQVEA